MKNKTIMTKKNLLTIMLVIVGVNIYAQNNEKLQLEKLTQKFKDSIENFEDNSSFNSLLSLKTLIRTKDFEASKTFYTQILNLEIIEEYDDGNGSKGIIMRFGPIGSNAFFEISEISDNHSYYQEQFSKNLENDKIDIQLRTDNIEFWAMRLKEKWNARGPILRPWGSQYLYLRDPDGLQIIIYQEKSK
ncbi:VOC family protein [Pontimicrobium aquaticum]|nr:VOC family protein [Pontimicrobium aquaticum]